jgi:hypothetical protein
MNFYRISILPALPDYAHDSINPERLQLAGEIIVFSRFRVPDC